MISTIELRGEINGTSLRLGELMKELLRETEKIRQGVYAVLTGDYGFERVIPSIPGFVDAVAKDGVEISLVDFTYFGGRIRIDMGIPLDPTSVQLSQDEQKNFRFTRCKKVTYLAFKDELLVDESDPSTSVSQIIKLFQACHELLARKTSVDPRGVVSQRSRGE